MKKGGAFLTTLLLFSFFYPSHIVLASAPDHILISEVQMAGTAASDDFIELYNPTNQVIALAGFRLVKRTQNGATDTSIKSFTGAETIQPFSFYLWANSGYVTINPHADVTTTASIAADNGVALRQGALDTGTIIDAVGFGAFSGWTGYTNIANPASSNSVVKKFVNSEPTVFVLNTTPHPQSSASPARTLEQMTSDTNEAPTAEAGTGPTVMIGTEASFDGSTSSDPEGGALTYSWDFGDGGTSADIAPTHVFTTTGAKTVTLTVTDPQGKTGTDTCSATIQDRPPAYVPPPAELPTSNTEPPTEPQTTTKPKAATPTETKPKETPAVTTTPTAKPNVPAILVSEKPSTYFATTQTAAVNPTVTPTTPSAVILVDSGTKPALPTTKIASTNSESVSPVPQVPVAKPQSTRSPWQEPIVAVPVMLVLVAFVSFFVITPKEFTKLGASFAKKEDALGDEIENLFR